MCICNTPCSKSISPWKEQLARPSDGMRQKYNFQWILTTPLPTHKPTQTVHLPHSGRRSQQLLLSIPETSEWYMYSMYSLHQKKVYTCVKSKYSKAKRRHWVSPNWTRPHFEIPSNISLNYKMRLGPVLTNSIGCAAHTLLFTCPPQFCVLGSKKVYTYIWWILYIHEMV